MARDDKGVAAMSLVLVAPILLTITFGVIQQVLISHAQNAAEAAAQEGAAAAREYDGSTVEAREVASRFAANAAGGMLHDVHVDASRDGETAAVTVRGSVPIILGLGSYSVEETSTGPVERFVHFGGDEP